VRQLEAESFGRSDKVSTQEADDGFTAIELMRAEAAAGRCFDIILMDYIMVGCHETIVMIFLAFLCSCFS